MLISLILIKMILVKEGDNDSFDAFGHDQMLIHLIQIKVLRAMKKMVMKKNLLSSKVLQHSQSNFHQNPHIIIKFHHQHH